MQVAYQKHKPKVILFLSFYFAWVLIKDIASLLFYKTSTDYLLLKQIGFSSPALFAGIMMILIIAELMALWFLVQPRLMGFWVAIVAVVFSALESAAMVLISLLDLDAAKQAYIISRQARGLSIRENAMNTIFSPSVMYVTLIFVLGFAAVLIALLIWKKGYFNEETN